MTQPEHLKMDAETATNTVSAAFLEGRLSQAELRAIGAEINPETKKPWLPAPKSSRWKIKPFMNGLLDYLLSRSRRAQRLPEFKSMKDCEITTGIPKSVLGSLKDKGCPGFHNGKVYLDKIIPWVFNQSEEDVRNWSDHFEKYKALNEEERFKKVTGEVIDKAVAAHSVRAIVTIFFTTLSRMQIDLPTALEGRDRMYIKNQLETINSELRDRLQNEIKQLEEDK